MIMSGWDLLVFAAVILPIAILAADSFRARHNPRLMMLSVAYLLIAANEVLYILFRQPFYFFHVLIDGIVISLAIIPLISDEKSKIVYPPKFFFHQAFLYMAILGVVALDIVEAKPERANLLATIVLVVTSVFTALVILQSPRGRRDPLFFMVLTVWAAAHIGIMSDKHPGLGHAITLALFGISAVGIAWYVLSANAKMFSENILLFRSRQVVLSMLNDISASPENITSVDRTLHRVLEALTESLAVEAAALYKLESDAEGPVLKFNLATGTFYPLTPEDDFILSKPQLIQDHLEQSFFRKGDGVVGIVADNLEPMILDRKAHYTRMMSLGLNTRVVRNLLAVPFKIKDALYGVFVVQNTKNGEMFGDDDLRLLEALADQATVAVNNTQMYSELTKTVRLRQETNIAMRIQKQLLPTSVPKPANLRIADYILPAKEVGGDYYDFIQHADGTLGIAIGDVSGKGVPAGMIMAIAKTIVQIVARDKQDVKAIVASFSKEIYPYMQRGQFMTLNYLRWVAETRTLYFAGAGHEHILWFHAKTGQTDRVKAGGLAAGLMADPSDLVKAQELKTQAGDVIVLYTDGVTEARNSTKEMFTLRRLQASLESYAFAVDPDRIRDQIIRDVNDFMAGEEQYDDITLLVLSII
jgi:serine phosphatase RsbU (regulator of sigma subunit)